MTPKPIFGLLLFFLVLNSTMAQPQKQLKNYSDAEVTALLIQSSKDFNKQLPSGNANSTMVTTTVMRRTLVFYSMVHPSAGVFTPERIANAKQIAINTFCSIPDPVYRELDVTFEYQNVDEQSRPLFKVSASRRDCR